MTQTSTSALFQLLRAIDERFWLRHGLFWLVRTLLMAWMLLYGARIMVEPQFAIRDALLVLLPHALITYLLLYGVLPALWRSNRWRLALLLVGWLAASLIIHHGFRFFVMVPLYEGRQTISPDLHNAFATGAFFPVLVTVGVAACLRVYRQWRQRDVDNRRLMQENYQVELQLLKAQVHPHFLFNTLNNLYALTLKQSSQASEVVERLTGLLQFVVEQGNAAQVSLIDEVKLLRDYIALEQLRYGTRLNLEFRADNIPASTAIAPLLLLPLVENAFKHGSAEQVGEASIRINLAVEGGRFTFLITNTKNTAPTARIRSEGIGLRNVRKRLQLLYPQRHQFTIEVRDDTFTVRLTLLLPELIATTESQSSGRVAPIHRVAVAAGSVALPLLLPEV